MKKLFFGLIATLLLSVSSFANENTSLPIVLSSYDLANEKKLELFATSTVSSEVTYSNYDDDCKWYFVTKITTVTHFILDFPIWVEIRTETTLECR